MSESALQKHRAVVTFGSAGIGVATVLAGAALVAVGTPAGASTSCAAVASSSSPSSTATTTVSPTASPTSSDPLGGILGGILGGGGTPTPTGSATATPTTSATATPTSSSSPSPATTIAVSPRRVTRGEAVKVITHSGPGCLVTLYAATRPSTTFKAAHTATTDANGYAGWAINPASDTSLYVTSESGSTSPTSTVTVRYRISLRVTRVGVRTMRFDGGVTPGGGGTTVDLWRSGSAGTVHVGKTRTADNGGYSLTATLPAGRYTFYALVATTANNDANRSPYVQATVS